MSSFRGQTFVRTMKALGVGRGDLAIARAYATSQQPWRGDVNDIDLSLRAAVTATGRSDIAPPSPAAHDFAEFTRPMTILGKLTGLRRVPSRTRLISAVSGSTAYWAGERAPRPISKADYDGDTLEPLGVTAIVVSTLELLRSSNPTAESTLSRDLGTAATAAMDLAFIDPANAGEVDAKPAAVTNGVTPIPSSGSAFADVDDDLAAAVEALSDAGSDLVFAAWVLLPRTALYLARLRGPDGALAYPGLTVKGGVLLGLPAVVSAHVPVELGSPGFGNTSIALIDAGQVLVADDGGGALEVSTETALQLESEPGDGAQSLTSLWQTDSVALKTTRYANWAKRRDGMVQVVSGVPY